MLRNQLLSLGVAVSTAGAQATITAPLTSPTQNDSIYKLAVSPNTYPEQTFVYLLDDGVVRLEPDGTGSRTYHQVIEMLKPEAVEQFSERSFSYSPGHEKMTINWLRVIRPNGETVEQPSQIQDANIPAEVGDPVYSDSKVRRASLTGLEPGALLDYSVTTEELKPFLPGDFLLNWSVTTGAPTLRSRYVVDFPATYQPRIKERNLTFKPKVQVSNGRRVTTWAMANVPFDKPEPFAADSNGVRMSVRIGAPIAWADIAKWYARNARNRYVVSPGVATKVNELVRGATTRDDSIRAIHKWVAQDIRYVSIALGLGGYQPRSPDTVVATGFGDCKDKATLFITALKHIGVTAYPVLLNSYGVTDRSLPSINQFDHVIVAIAEPSGYRYVDMTADLVPYGQLPLNEQGTFGLVVHPGGSEEEISFPATPASTNREETKIVGTLSSDGLFNGVYEERASGSLESPLRSLFENPLDSATRANLPNRLAAQYFEGATGDSLTGFNGKDLGVPAVVRIRIINGRATQHAGTTEVLSSPFGSMASMATSARELSKEAKRKFPIDATMVFGSQEISTEFRVTLPDGWRAKLPRNITASSVFGSYRSEYSQAGHDLLISRTISGTRGVYAPQRMNELVSWFDAIGKDDARFIVLERGISLP